MIDRTAVRRLTLVSAVLFAVAGAAALAVWRSPALAGGIALGFALGLTPFLSWTWIASGWDRPGRRAAAVAFLLIKMALYAGALWLLVMRDVVSPAGVAVGLTIVVFTFVGGALLMPPAKPNGAHP